MPVRGSSMPGSSFIYAKEDAEDSEDIGEAHSGMANNDDNVEGQLRLSSKVSECKKVQRQHILVGSSGTCLCLRTVAITG